MVTKFEKEICKKLILIYESRYNKGSDFGRKISIKFDETGYKKYVADEAYKYREAINEAVKIAERNDYISVIYVKGTNEEDISEVRLNLKNVEAVYVFLGLASIESRYQQLFNRLASIGTPIADAFYKVLKEKRKTKGSLINYINKSTEYIDALKAINAIGENRQDIYLRNLSVRLFNDSKRLESLNNFVLDILITVGEPELTWEEYLLQNGVLKNPNYIYLKGTCVIRINEQKIDLSKLKTVMAICSDSVKDTTFLSIGSNTVTTIENLTTFHAYRDKGLIIYLGGFSNHSKVEILKKINGDIRDLSFRHFGDMDFGGFSILSHLRRNTSIAITPIHMDIKMLKDRIKLSKKPSSAYLTKLRNLLSDKCLQDCYEVLKFMIDSQVILEQETY